MIRDTQGQDKQVTPRRNSKKWLLLASGLLATTALTAYSVPKFSQLLSTDLVVSQSVIQTAFVERGDMLEDIRVEGKTLAAINPAVYAIAPGTVTLHVKAGDNITQGQDLLSINSPELRNQLLQEQATLARLETEFNRQKITTEQRLLDTQQRAELARVDLEAASSAMERANASIEKQIISKLELEEKIVALKRAELNKKHAIEALSLEQKSLNFELKIAELALTRQQHLTQELERQVAALTIQSPLTGIVGTVNVQQKQHVQRDAELMSLVDLSELEVEAFIPENLADELAIGLAANIQINQQTYPATLVAISPEVEQGRVAGRIRFDQQPEKLRQNQRVSAQLILSQKQDVLKIKRGAFVETGAGKIAYLINEGQAQRQSISIGAKSIHEVELTSGVKAGDKLIISSLAAFQNQQNVMLSN
ncbi:HlyD family efflux transporter periplasmic adaptor subunit [Pseudoalteromonas sp. BZB3]|uniref:efflux RND transporter periplasmic adaptor subunit n=1 Tax=Pseudoalteromonas sp. BZB3 TaxID=3136670 RepID=UPI0032C416CD